MAQKQHSPKNIPAVHFVGIGGIGVSSLARYFLAEGWRVSGSDAKDSQLIRELKRDGARIRIGHTAGALPSQTHLLVYSQAIAPDNPERQLAKRRKIPEVSYPKIVGVLTSSFETIAVAGAHGKSTTSAMTALVLRGAQLDPTVIVGTKLREFGGSNFRAGGGKYLVLEADEYGRAFLNYDPAHVIVLNIDREHLDIYKDLKDIQNTFLKFLSRVRPGGTLVLNRSCQELFALRKRIVSLATKNRYRLIWYSANSASFRKVAKVLRLPGLHNRENATAVFELARVLHIPENKILAALSRFKGTWRRMEYRGELRIENNELRKITNSKKNPVSPTVIRNSHFVLRVYDDYAHHPTEVKATLAALREKYPKANLVCVFEPHQAKRLKALFPEFISAFKEADVLILLPMYAPAGRDKTDTRYTSATLSEAIQKKYPARQIVYLSRPERVAQLFPSLMKGGVRNVVVMMGAGSIAELTRKMLILGSK